jgi:4a-hydroxytetrahydrobiopterin dehydratase
MQRDGQPGVAIIHARPLREPVSGQGGAWRGDATAASAIPDPSGVRINEDKRDVHPPAEGPASVDGWQSQEIVMTQWRSKQADEVYTEAETQARLAQELPTWTLEGGWIRRKFKTSGWKGTLMVVNTVGHLAEAAWHHPDLTVSYAFVTVKLMNHAAKGITEKDFALAKKIEDVLMWQPARDEPAVLEGTPDDPRLKYLKYD